ncbi:hypothetical protein XocBAI15_01470 [Xanthomonas oryzae pv. oryzicola]|nr:hypothetical protein BE73_17080 [Xanthomonas oryzae pv. oryzicola]OWB30586.1 hypothetical protein XocBAI15_01470 [Xanthomonas oryzae pv. oryzicola]OWB33548.1 hypothetical protein XocBAI21_02750 [Xanthomonas oryzae pv. oryzicola]QBH04624.1 hypothetical protein EYC57_16285 [Xanthomonas oryzae]
MSHVAPHVSQPSGCLRLLTLAFFVQVSSGQKDPKIPTCSIRSYRMITVFRSLPSLPQRGDYIQSATSVSVASHDAQARHTALAFLTPAPVRGTRTGTHSLRASASRPQDVNPGHMGVLCIDHASPMAEPNSYVDIIPLEISQHILYGDGSGSGGHMWPGQQGKSVFPQSWGADKIIHHIGDIATCPKTTWYVQTGSGETYTRRGDPAKWVAFEVRGGVRIRVIYQPAIGKVITAFPDDTPMPSLKKIE